MTQKSPPIARSVQRYLSRSGSIRACLGKDLVNLSALSRQLCEELGVDQFDAVLKACRRYQQRIQSLNDNERIRRELISRARVQVRTKIVVATLRKPATLEKVDLLQKVVREQNGDFNLIEGTDVLTIITNRRFVSVLRKDFGSSILRLSEDLVQVCMIMDPSIERISGVVAYIYGILFENGVNLREEMSCFTDVMFIIDERDLVKTMSALNFKDLAEIPRGNSLKNITNF